MLDTIFECIPCGTDWSHSDELAGVLLEEESGDSLYECEEVADSSRGAGWEKIAAVVDSGAVDNVLPEEMITFVPLEPSERSKAGKGFRGPAGEPIPARGQRITVVKTAEGQTRKTKWQVCPVKRALVSVDKLNEAGNTVHFTKNDPHIINIKTGEKTVLRREGKVFIIDLWVKRAMPPQPKRQPKKKSENHDMDIDGVFTRRGR